MTAGCDNGCIKRMVAVAVGTDLEQPPAGAQEVGQLAADDDAAFGLTAFGEFQVLLDVVLEKAADIAGVVQVAFAECFGFLGTEILAQQAGAFGQPICLVRLDEGDIALPAFAVLSTD